MKKILLNLVTVLLVIVGCLLLTGCGKFENNEVSNVDDGNKVTESKNDNKTFPVADFIPSGVQYNGGGTIEHVITGVTSADLYIRNATLEDALSYVSLLKGKGLTYANPVKEEPIGINEFGYFAWTGANSDDTFCVTVNFLSEEEQDFNDVKGNKVIYNMSINLANENIYGE